MKSNETTETAAQALARIQGGVSRNDAAVMMAFEAAGIVPREIVPRENVLTAKAWSALGRRMAKGSKALMVPIMYPCSKKDRETGEKVSFMRKSTARLFHVDQTVERTAPKYEGPQDEVRPAAWENPALIREGMYETIETAEDAAAAAGLLAAIDAELATVGPDSPEFIGPRENGDLIWPDSDYGWSLEMRDCGRLAELATA